MVRSWLWKSRAEEMRSCLSGNGAAGCTLPRRFPDLKSELLEALHATQHTGQQGTNLAGGPGRGRGLNLWSFLINTYVIGSARYMAAQNAGVLLKMPRYPFFVGQWIVIVFVLAIVVAHFYAWTRQTLGSGPKSALRVGFSIGLIAGFPLNFAQSHLVGGRPRASPGLGRIEMWLGAILASLVAGFIYKD